VPRDEASWHHPREGDFRADEVHSRAAMITQAFGMWGPDLEPVTRIELVTCRLQEVWPGAPLALAAQIARHIALLTLAELGLSGPPFHEPFHGGSG
jgi:hypothetical protein